VHGDSAAGRKLLWKNKTDAAECDLSPANWIAKDPLLDDQYHPQTGSPCIDGGQVRLQYQGESLVLPAEFFQGSAPDLGAKEAR
jgi:hypothetical protein